MTPVASALCPIQQPNLQNRRTVLATGLSAVAAPSAGAGPDFRTMLAQAYGGAIDPLKAHRLAIAETARLLQRADVLLRAKGFGAGSVAERLRKLYSDMNRRIAEIRPALARALGDLPINDAGARRMSPQDETAGRGGYRTAPQPSMPGAYFVDLKAIRTRPSWTLPSAAFHEVIPGHLLQMALQDPAPRTPPQGVGTGAFFEAWAIYAEQLAADLGAYRNDPLGEVGYLQWRLFRIGRVVADIGIHVLGWTSDRAIQAMSDLQGQSIAFISIEADVERIAKTPGKYAAEGLGALTLDALRPHDRAAWPNFHKLVLGGAPWAFGDLSARAVG